MTFHRGQKVALIDASGWAVSGYGDEIYPEQGGVYTVRDIVHRVNGPALLLEEIRNDVLPYAPFMGGEPADAEQAFSARRFKPVVNDETRRELEAA